MGLSCSHEIIKAIGGKLRLISSVEGNTVFEIKMPVNIENILNKNYAERDLL